MTTNRRKLSVLPLAMSALVAASTLVVGQDTPRPKVGYKDTPMLPGGRWHVHDSDRPFPPVITPGTCSTQDEPGKAPSDAVVLFDGKDLAHWQSGRGREARWTVQDGAMVAKPGAGEVRSRDEFGDCQIHLEFASPNPPHGKDQDRGNSGVIIFGLYEIQVLDSYENITYADGQAAAIYGQYPPLVNASRAPGQWQTYDIVFTAPRFQAEGSLESPAYTTSSAQRGPGPQPRRARRPDGLPRQSPLQGSWPQGPHRPPGPRAPGQVPQHLGPADQGLRRALSRGPEEPARDGPHLAHRAAPPDQTFARSASFGAIRSRAREVRRHSQARYPRRKVSKPPSKGRPRTR